jgi:hypothetical protein
LPEGRNTSATILACSRSNFIGSVRYSVALAVLLYEALFLNVLVPIHTRGAITLSGREGASCCASHETQKSSKRTPTDKDRQNCAVCNFAARMSTPPVVSCVMPELGLVQLLPVPPPVTADSIAVRLPYFGRAPPAFA